MFSSSIGPHVFPDIIVFVVFQLYSYNNVIVVLVVLTLSVQWKD